MARKYIQTSVARLGCFPFLLLYSELNVPFCVKSRSKTVSIARL